MSARARARARACERARACLPYEALTALAQVRVRDACHLCGRVRARLGWQQSRIYAHARTIFFSRASRNHLMPYLAPRAATRPSPLPAAPAAPHPPPPLPFHTIHLSVPLVAFHPPLPALFSSRFCVSLIALF